MIKLHRIVLASEGLILYQLNMTWKCFWLGVSLEISIWDKAGQYNIVYSIRTTWDVVHALCTFVLAVLLAGSGWVSSLFIINHSGITLYSPESVLNLNWTTTPVTRSNWKAIICSVPSTSPPQTGWFLMFIVRTVHIRHSYCSQKTGGALFCFRLTLE